MKIETCLVLAAHTDDGELGCGATIARLREEGTRVVYAAFSACEESVPEGHPRDVLRREAAEATAVLGIQSEDLVIYDFPVRQFPSRRQAILEEMVALRGRVQPQLVLMPSQSDVHQDHQVVCAEGIRAFKHSSQLAYDMPQNNYRFDMSFFVPLQPQHLDRKWEALCRYRSQAGRPYMREEYIRSLAVTRGCQIHVPLAEAFEVLRWIQW
jgi:LmbE family N-acetylglucosaminyl deacetylase